MKRKILIFSTLLFALSLCSLAYADSRTIREKIFRTMDADPDFGPYEIEIDARHGSIILDGKVTSDHARQKAEAIALAQPDVHDVQNHLQIAELINTKISSSELARRVKERIEMSPALRSYSIDIASRGETIVLSGEVKSDFDRVSAERLARAVEGVEAVTNNLSVARVDTDEEVTRRVREALASNPEINSSGLEILTQNGVVTLRGQRDSHRERDRILSVVLMVKGVRDVKSELRGQY